MSRVPLLFMLAASWMVFAAEPAAKPPEPVYGQFETTLATETPQIRMFALDGDANTYFASKGEAAAGDHFTFVLEKPVTLKSVAVVTGRVKETDLLDKGTLQISEDGKEFVDLGKFGADGKIKEDGKGKKVLALRLKPSEDLKHPLAVREFTIDSDPPVAVFKHPVEIFTVCEDEPTLKEWTDKTARVCERQYQMICEELKSEGFIPKTVVNMKIVNSYNGVAMAGGGNITGSVAYFKKNQKDVGAMVHEMVHVAQNYGRRRGGSPNPGWLVEGLADYIRCYKYEGGKLRPLRSDAKYNGSYQITAHFLNYVKTKYNKELIGKLNTAMREGKYSEELWKELTQKTIEELGQEWSAASVPAPVKKPDAAEKKPDATEKKPDVSEKKPTT